MKEQIILRLVKEDKITIEEAIVLLQKEVQYIYTYTPSNYINPMIPYCGTGTTKVGDSINPIFITKL